MKNNYLVHWGIKGQKWGQRRYQNKDGTWTPLGKSRRREEDGDADDPNETIEAKKQRILRSKNPALIYKNSHLFTDQEIQSAGNRLQSEEKIKGLIPQEKHPIRDAAKNSIKELWSKAVMPEVTKAGQKAVNDFLVSKGLIDTPKKDTGKLLDEIGKAADNIDKATKVLNDSRSVTFKNLMYEFMNERGIEED